MKSVLAVLGVCLGLVMGCSKNEDRTTLTGNSSCPYSRNVSVAFSQCRDYADNWYRSQSPLTPERNKSVYDTMNGVCCMGETQRRTYGN